MQSPQSSDDLSPIKISNAIQNEDDKSSDDDGITLQRNKRIVQRFSDSDTEKENLPNDRNKVVQDEKLQNNSDSESGNSNVLIKSGFIKSRIRLEKNSSDSESSTEQESVKNHEQQLRMNNKRHKLKEKFKSLLSSREKSTVTEMKSDKQTSEDCPNEASDDEMSSVAKIKQKIKKSMASFSSICDPDTSDEESNVVNERKPKQKQRKERKSTKMTEPKPIRMSAKQAMENMTLIKSESNRMLREKAVSLPYHRPKALSLKDIMSRRKPAVSSDGKVLPIKMNEEQLKQYAMQLEERQKEMMELCKSESDDETAENIEENDNTCQEAEQSSDSNNIKGNVNSEKVQDTIESLENNNLVNDCLPSVQLTENDSDKAEPTEIETTNSDSEPTEKAVKTPNTVEEDNLLQVEQLSKLNSEQESQLITLHFTEKCSEELEHRKTLEESEKNDSHTDLKLVYNDSVKENIIMDAENRLNKDVLQNDNIENIELQQVSNTNTEPESQLISLHYTEKQTNESEQTEDMKNNPSENSEEKAEENMSEENKDNFFSDDDDVNMDDIDEIIESAEILKDSQTTKVKPKLTGAPGMVIDLDDNKILPSKPSGVELLKERFIYFSKLKTPEELEREKEKKLKPGAQHLKLKQELEEKIAEQRSLEWAKRLEEEKQQHKEMETILDDADDSFDKLEAELDDKPENEEEREESSSENEEDEELEENDIEIKDKPRKHNPMVDDEAEESDCEETEAETDAVDDGAVEDTAEGDNNMNEDDEEDDSSEEEESSESEEEEVNKPKKGRILKAFEDSDEEDATNKVLESTPKVDSEANNIDAIASSSDIPTGSQDDVIQLAQRAQSVSDDLFTSQESSTLNDKNKDGVNTNDEEIGTQTFSILDSTSGINFDTDAKSPSKIISLYESQPYHEPNLNAVVGSQLPITQSSQSQTIGEDILALCTGKFYDNEFVSQTEESPSPLTPYEETISNNDFTNNEPINELVESNDNHNLNKEDTQPLAQTKSHNMSLEENTEKKTSENENLLKSILDELNDDEYDKPRSNKYFTGGNKQSKEDEKVVENTQIKKKFVIDSDDETNEKDLEVEQGKKKKLKKKKAEKRALQISDDEEDDEPVEQEEDDYMSDLEEEPERLVEYDSEENEIEVTTDQPKKKRKVADFFEQEAELTSEDEWVGSGDEDEKDLDRMEREEGDDEVFHQGKLRRELGQIHMRDVLDQDKREVRLIQELLFEDGDLGGGHRQRKFRWRNAGDGDETGTVPDEFGDTQEEEYESEEQWRKQRHERQVFLRQMQQQAEEESSLNVSVNRTTIIKANLLSKSMSMLLQEVNQSKVEKPDNPAVQEKKTAKDIPSPKKAFSIFQQSYHGSLLTRGRGALARLAALATPLAVDNDDAPKIGSLASHKRNFVFAAVTPDEDDEPKVTIKRKADTNLGTPKLVKKMKVEEKQTRLKSSLLDHLNL